MLARPWLPLVASVLIPALTLSAWGEEKQPPSHIEAEIADLEFEVKKRELACQMADLGVKEAELALERIGLQIAGVNSDKARLGVDREEARIHVKMRELNQQAAQLDLEQVRARLGRLKTTAESKPAITGPVPVPLKHIQGADAKTLPASKEDTEKVLVMIKKREQKSEQSAAIKRLLSQRRDTLREIVELAEAQYRDGRGQQRDVFRAAESLIDAELDLATDKAERIALRERRLDIMKRMEEHTRARREVAAVNNAEVLAATAERLKAEIELLQERASE